MYSVYVLFIILILFLIRCQWVLEQYRTTYVSGLAAADPIGLIEMESKLQAQIRDYQTRVTKLVQRRGTEIQDTSSLAVKAQEAASHATKFMQGKLGFLVKNH